MSIESKAATVNNPSAPPSQDESQVEADAQLFKPSKAFYLVFLVLLVLTLMIALDSTIVAVAFPAMAQQLNGSALQTFWTGSSFLLSSAIFILPIVSMSHIFGRMQTTVACLVLFLVGIVTASVAQNFTVLIIGRTIQGVGGGGIAMLIDVITTDIVPMRQRGSYMGIISAGYAVGTVCGPVVGGALTYRATWRWIFWINIPFAVLGLVLVPMYLRLKPVPGSTLGKLKRVDWLGAAIFIGAITSLLMPITWGGVQFPWSSPSTLVPLIIGAVALFGVFGSYEWTVPREPMIRLHLFKTYNFWFAVVGGMLHNLITYGILYFLPLYFEAVKGYNPLLAGVALFPITFTCAPMAIIGGIVITKTGRFRPTVWLGWSITTLGAGVMTFLDDSTSLVRWVFLTLCFGIGVGLLFTSLNIVCMVGADDQSVAFALGIFMFLRMLGQSLGVAICGTIFQNRMLSILLESSYPILRENAVQYSRDAQTLVGTIATMPDGAEKVALIAVYAKALQGVWTTMCGIAGLGFLGSVFLKHKDVNRALGTNQGLMDE